MHARHAAQAPRVPDASEDVSDAAAGAATLGDVSRMVAELDNLDVQLKERAAEVEAAEAEAAASAAPESGEAPSLQ